MADVDDLVDVVVLGAGVAGLAAGVRLHEAGLRVCVLEARERLGGRIHSVHTADAPLPVELGAEFVHGPAALAPWLREAGLVACDVPFRMHSLGPDGLEPAGAEMFGALGELLALLSHESPGDVSVGSFVATLRERDERWQELGEQVLQYVRGFHAADPERMSVLALADEEQAHGDSEGDQRLAGGYDRLIEHLAGRLGDERVRRGATATEVSWERGRVTVTYLQRGRVRRQEAAQAVVTLPLGVLQAPAGEPGAVRFSPHPERLRDAVLRLAVGPALHVALCFRRPFWEELSGADGASLRDLSFFRVPQAPVPVWWTKLPLRTSVLTGWSGGPDAARLVGRPADEVLAAALDSLGRALRRTEQQLREELRSWHHHDWGADPLARGAYSYVPVGGRGAQQALAEPFDATLFFGGEATHEGGDTGTVHGALQTGERAARQVLAAREPRPQDGRDR